MKKFTLLLGLIIFSQLLFSQVYTGNEAHEFVKGADIVRFSKSKKTPSYIHFHEGYTLDLKGALDYMKSVINSPQVDFQLLGIQNNSSTDKTYRYKQTLDGCIVEFSALNIHINNGKVYAINGELWEEAPPLTKSLLSEQVLLANALKHFNAKVYMWEDNEEEVRLKSFTNQPDATYYPKGEKVLVPVDLDNPDSDLRVSYKFDISSKVPYDRKNIYVDVQNGNILLDLPLIYNNTQAEDVIGTAHTQYSGVREISTTFNGTEYILKDNTRGKGIYTLNCKNTNKYDRASDFTDDDNIWEDPTASLTTYAYAIDAHFGTMAVYDYLLNVHGRNSIDGEGHQLYSYIHYNLIADGQPNNANAFWNGMWMTYGDGDPANEITPFTTVDVCAHEITHGLTTYTANLIYRRESGALNESFSDIFGTAIEFYATPEKANWLIGEETGRTMRSMQSPKDYSHPDTYKGNYWVTTGTDNGGVHTNSGVFNYWFYLVSEGGSGVNDLDNSYEVTGIGIEKAEKIAFRLLTVYLTSNSNYSDAAFLGIRAAKDLYGECSEEVKTVGDAFYAIGVTEQYVPEFCVNFTALDTRSCSAPFEVQFINTTRNTDSYLWDFGDGTTSTEENPVHIYANPGKYTVKLTVENELFVKDTKTVTDFIIIEEGLECHDVIPLEGNKIIEKCNGIIYHPGGPENNYLDNASGSVTIHSKDASYIILDIKDFDIESGSSGTCDKDYIAFYDGNSPEAPLISDKIYCNNSGNPETIQSTGEYITIYFKSDESTNRKGFRIEYSCVGDNRPPIPYFSVDKRSSFDGLFQFTDESLNTPTEWEWDFGDGKKSTEQNPFHQYISNGDYTVTLHISNASGEKTLKKENYVSVNMYPAPVIKDIDACNDRDFEIKIELKGDAHWFNNIGETTPVHIGNTWNHPAVPNEKTYYVREVFEELSQNVGETNYTEGGTFSGQYNDYLRFDAYVPLTIKSVLVNSSEQGEITILLKNIQDDTLDERKVQVPKGISRIELNMEISAEKKLRLAAMGTPSLYNISDPKLTNFPYVIEDVINIGSSLYGGYPYFFDWEIVVPMRKTAYGEAKLIPQVCTSISEENASKNIIIAPNPSTGIFQIHGIEDNDDYCITVYNVSGKEIKSYSTGKNKVIDITDSPEGIYFVKIKSITGTKIIKLIKQK